MNEPSSIHARLLLFMSFQKDEYDRGELWETSVAAIVTPYASNLIT